jgi:hypothetical protein
MIGTSVGAVVIVVITATGGASTEVFMLAVWRTSEICIGSRRKQDDNDCSKAQGLAG